MLHVAVFLPALASVWAAVTIVHRIAGAVPCRAP